MRPQSDVAPNPAGAPLCGVELLQPLCDTPGGHHHVREVAQCAVNALVVRHQDARLYLQRFAQRTFAFDIVTLSDAVARASRQLRTLEQHLAPRIARQISVVRLQLDEREREERLRLKHLQRRHATAHRTT